MNLGSFFIFSLILRHKCVVVPATVAAVRPAGTNHALSLIKIVIFSNIGFVGGADVGGMTSVGMMSVGMTSAGMTLAGMTSVGMTSGQPATKSATEAAAVLIIMIKPLASRLRRPPPPISGGRGGVSLNGGSGSNLNLSSSSSSVHFALNTSYFPLPHHPPQLSFVHFPFPSPSPLPSLKFVLNFPAWFCQF